MTADPVEIMWQGRFITAKREGKWEYVGRARNIRAAVILAIDDGHVLLVDGRNVTRGDRLVYDLDTGQAVVQGGSSRVTGVFFPNSSDSAGDAKPARGAKSGAGRKK